jgi:hypothetical protein
MERMNAYHATLVIRNCKRKTSYLIFYRPKYALKRSTPAIDQLLGSLNLILANLLFLTASE